MKITKYIAIFSTALIAQGCSTASKETVLSAEGQNVSLIKAPISQSCKFLGEVKGGDTNNFIGNANRDVAYTHALNKAGKLGANRMQITSDSGEGARVIFKANAFKCSDFAGRTNDEILKGCTEGSGDACFELSSLHYAAEDVENASDSMDRACEFKYVGACAVAQKLQTELKKKQKITALGKGCLDKNLGQACLDLTVMANEDGFKDQAMRFAQLACTKGKPEGCTLYTQYSQEVIAAQNQTLQRQSIQQQDQLISMQQQEMLRAQSERNNQALQSAFSSLLRSPAQTSQPQGQVFQQQQPTKCTTKAKYAHHGGQYVGSDIECR